MRPAGNTLRDRPFNERLASSGLRVTAQRQLIYDTLLRKRDHPSAEDLFIRARKCRPDISMATVYNGLDALVRCGLVRLVTLDRGPTRYCTNMREHGHFCCDVCGRVYDVDLVPQAAPAALRLPAGCRARRDDIAVHGTCPECARRRRRDSRVGFAAGTCEHGWAT
ncbi:MAG: transcriptional repressor [Verrucomicrobia bacterium]|nr:transcriptional repressor [Verrucomicrobiota bacterium]